MFAREKLKRISIRLGIYPLARKAYRSVSPQVRAQINGDKSLYGQFINPGNLVFDIGANMGQKSQVFVALGATTVALEPNPHCWKIIERDLGRSELFHLVRKAVGASEGEAILNFAHTASTASLDPDWDYLEYRDAPLERAPVQVTTMDILIADYGVPDFCKIDVEGFEVEVLKGLSTPIPVLSLEFQTTELEHLQKCTDLLAQLGNLEANVISMNGTSLFLEKWATIPEIFDYLGTAEAPPSGDIFVRIRV